MASMRVGIIHICQRSEYIIDVDTYLYQCLRIFMSFS
jgi:hypothetical protein